MPAMLFTFLSRTQTLLVENNRGGSLAAIDPYRDPEPEPRGEPSFLGRMRRRLLRALGGVATSDRTSGVALEDPRTLAQFRALQSILGNLDELHQARLQVRSLRRRSDREIFRNSRSGWCRPIPATIGC